MADTLSRIAKDSNSIRRDFIWECIGTYIVPLFGEPATPLDWVIARASHHVPWHSKLVNEDTVTRWAATASAAPYTEEVCESVVDALLRIASVDSLRPYIPFGIWAWLKKRPYLRDGPFGSDRSRRDVIRHIRTLEDIEILTSYFLLVLSNYRYFGVEFGGFAEMRISIHEDFGGIGVGRHREDLIKKLDRVIKEAHEWTRPDVQTIERCGELKRALVDLDRDAVKILTRASPRLVIFGLLTPVDTYRIPLDLHVHLASSGPVVSHLGNIVLLPPTNHKVVRTRTPIVITEFPHPLPSYSPNLP